MKLAVISAGLSTPSSTRLLADRLTEAVAHELDVDVEVIELRELAHDLANNLVSGFPTGKLRDAIATVEKADALIAVSPIFTASYSGLFKTFFDVLDPSTLEGTPVLIGATGGTERHSLVLEHALRPLFAYLRAVVVPTAVYAATQDWGSDSGLQDRIDRAASQLAALLTGAPRDVKTDPYDEPTPFAQLLADGGIDAA